MTLVATNANWTDLTDTPADIIPIAFTGRYRSARRCIDPPRFSLSGPDGAALWDIVATPLAAPETIQIATSTTPEVDLAPIWNALPLGSIQVTGRAFDASGALMGVTPLKTVIKAPDWSGGATAALDYAGSAAGVIRYLCDGLPASQEHPDDPAYMWHAAVKPAGDATAPNLQFPALSYPMLINLFLSGHRRGLGDDLVARATRLADFLIDHPMVDSGPLAGIPMSSMDLEGKGGLYEEDRTTLVRIGWTGITMLTLADETGNRRYREYAFRLGDILLATQHEDGSWPYRLRLSDGAVVESYTAAGVMALFLMERLGDEIGDARYTDAFDRGLDWIIANPVQTGLWQQMYEDVRTLEDYDNLEQWAALETSMMLLRRNHPEAVPIARKLVRYVEDQFVLFGDEASLPVPYLPSTPATMEQYHCYWPMDVHTANYARAALALYQATGEVAWGHKAVAAANTVVRCQRPDGRYSTLVPDRRLGTTPPFSDWFNCMAHAADVLLAIGPHLTDIAGKEAEAGAQR
ncbi:MAG: hypothetical protein K0S78_2886 [Thermomicrobiales bacterium]|jgi:hypothetical protein|nr:hypothetical protein [Thermomicrobiales bacterium]